MTQIAYEMFNINAITLSFQKLYTWSSGFKSPIYSDHRMLISNVEFRKIILNEFIKQIKENYKNVDVIAGVATAGIPHASWIAMQLDLPMLYVRPSQKKHGKENQIEGIVEPGLNVVLIEDVFTTGNSSIQAIQALKKRGVNVLGVIGILDYNFLELENNFKEEKIQYKAFYDFKKILQVSMEYNFFSPNEIKVLKDWIIESKKFDLNYLADILENMESFTTKSNTNLLVEKYQKIIDFCNIERKDILLPVKVDDKQLRALVLLLILRIWELYKNKNDVKVNIHSQGFIRFILTDTIEWGKGNGLRLHIWHKNIQIPFANVLNKQHRHSFLSESIILIGEQIIDKLYITKPADEKTQNAVRTYKTPPYGFIADEIVTLHHVQTRIAKQGWTLHYPKNLYHLHDDISNFVVTLFQKHSLDDVDSDSWTVGPIDMPEIEDPRIILPNQEEMWFFIIKVVQELAKMYNLSYVSKISDILNKLKNN